MIKFLALNIQMVPFFSLVAINFDFEILRLFSFFYQTTWHKLNWCHTCKEMHMSKISTSRSLYLLLLISSIHIMLYVRGHIELHILNSNRIKINKIIILVGLVEFSYEMWHNESTNSFVICYWLSSKGLHLA